MATSAELNALTVKELGSLAKELAVPGWHEMRKDELVRALVQKSRTKSGRELIEHKLEEASKNRAKQAAAKPQKKGPEKKGATPVLKSGEKNPSGKKSSTQESLTATQRKREVPRKRENVPMPNGKKSPSDRVFRADLRKANLIQTSDAPKDRLALLVRDPFWLHAFWELNSKTLKRAEVAMGHFWHSAIPILRLYRVLSDGAGAPKRQPLRDIRIHGGVNNWYIEVDNPPSRFQIEMGYLSRERKFYSLLSSNTVETPQRQIIDVLDNLDGNWRGVADDLDRIFKLSGGEENNQELKRVFEDKLQLSMSDPMLNRYRVARNGAPNEKTRRNFAFNIDADVIIHGKTDPSVQVTIRNEPIRVNPDGTFSVRFSFPEKRHLFSIEAEGSDGVEMQRVVLTVERNTRTLETLFHEPSEED